MKPWSLWSQFEVRHTLAVAWPVHSLFMTSNLRWLSVISVPCYSLLLLFLSIFGDFAAAASAVVVIVIVVVMVVVVVITVSY